MSFWKRVWKKEKEKKTISKETLEQDKYLKKLVKKINKLK
jgi:hypothetical protein